MRDQVEAEFSGDAAGDGERRWSKVWRGEDPTRVACFLIRRRGRSLLACLASLPPSATSSQSSHDVPDHAVGDDVAIALKDYLGNLVVVFCLTRLVAEDASFGRGTRRGLRQTGATRLGRRPRGVGCSAVGHVEDSEVLRDKGEETGTGSFDCLVEFVLPTREGLSQTFVSTVLATMTECRLTLQTAFLENLKIWL